MRKTISVARRVLGDSKEITLRMRWYYARAHYYDADATLDHLREAVTTLEDMGRIARRVFGSEHPITAASERDLRDARDARDALRARSAAP